MYKQHCGTTCDAISRTALVGPYYMLYTCAVVNGGDLSVLELQILTDWSFLYLRPKQTCISAVRSECWFYPVLIAHEWCVNFVRIRHVSCQTDLAKPMLPERWLIGRDSYFILPATSCLSPESLQVYIKPSILPAYPSRHLHAFGTRYRRL